MELFCIAEIKYAVISIKMFSPARSKVTNTVTKCRSVIASLKDSGMFSVEVKTSNRRN